MKSKQKSKRSGGPKANAKGRVSKKGRKPADKQARSVSSSKKRPSHQHADDGRPSKALWFLGKQQRSAARFKPLSATQRSQDLVQLSWQKLKTARFRQVNEALYSMTGTEAQELLATDPDAYDSYHEGYRQQVEAWPINPLDVMIESIKSMPENHVIADFGCGEGKLALSVPQKVHSFDLVSRADHIVACDVKKTPLKPKSVDVVVFCLSLMGTNLRDFILEANRVLKPRGLLKVAEVESRFLTSDSKTSEKGIEAFSTALQAFGFKRKTKDTEHDLFVFMDFKKTFHFKAVDEKGQPKAVPELELKPCLYKKR